MMGGINATAQMSDMLVPDGNEHDLAEEAIQAVVNPTGRNEYAIAREMQDADGIARHGVEGWRLLTTNWETTVNILRRQLEWQRIELRELTGRFFKAKASLRKAYRDNREVKARLLVQGKALRALQRKARKNDRARARR